MNAWFPSRALLCRGLCGQPWLGHKSVHLCSTASQKEVTAQQGCLREETKDLQV